MNKPPLFSIHHKTMSLRSNKRQVDLISKLHDALLIQILSFLPEPEATRTCILSKRWKNIWALLPILHFIMPFCWTIEENNRFHDFVDQALDLRNGLQIQRFHLYCSKNCNYDRVHNWFCKVVKCNVQELDLRFPAERFPVKFRWDLFSCLVSLTLRGEFILNVPDDILIPCLKTINLVSIVYSGNNSFKNLVSGCPVLEDLFVERQLIGGFDDMYTFEVVSPSLKRLRLSFAMSVYGNFRVVIDAPALDYLNILDVMSSNYSMTNPVSLTEAHIMLRTDGQIPQLLSCFCSSVKILTLSANASSMVCLIADLCCIYFLPYMVMLIIWFMQALTLLNDIEIPEYPNLVNLAIGIEYTRGWELLPDLLIKMPNLEHITFLEVSLCFFAKLTYSHMIFIKNWIGNTNCWQTPKTFIV
ncbi:F-box/LRR-repeat protein At3g59190-like [Bidens hawaiensis]|uniref:F-box/LRR-repeat protein At3g59190-like n=1 Tax=Bidens hawaiensis TaxID=980011 RepID=UPI00404B2BB3